MFLGSLSAPAGAALTLGSTACARPSEHMSTPRILCTVHMIFSRTVAHLSIVATLLAPFAYAQNTASSNFQVKNSALDDFGGFSSSTTFTSVESGGEITNTEATSTSFLLNAGPLFYETFVPKSQNWRWYDDENNETPVTALAGENVAPANIENADVIKLRIAVDEAADIGSAGVKFRLQFSTSSNFSESINWVDEQSNCTGSSKWCYGDGVDSDNAVITTALLTDSAYCIASTGAGCGTHNESGTSTSSFTHSQGTTTEYEFTLEQSGAAANTVYFFRLFHAAGSSSVPYADGESYPSLSTGGATLTFTINGLESGTTTEGVTTDVETTPTSVPFGTLAMSTPVEAAQRLTVSTSASSGYKIFAFERQALMSNQAATIDPVTGTNPVPASWNSGCPGSSAGCYGYHSGEDVMDGGSTRFSPNDSFAQFSQTPYEVAFSATPTTDKETDIVYKVEARNLQEAGSYESSLVYIVVPVF